MTPANHAATPPDGTVALDFDLSHHPEKVWRALTDPALLTRWLLPVSDLPLQRGAEFAFRAPAAPGWDGVVNCRLLEADPPHRLAYTWASGAIDTVVTFTLAPIATGTRLSIVQSGFTAENKREFGGAKYGWQMMTGRLTELLASVG